MLRTWTLMAAASMIASCKSCDDAPKEGGVDAAVVSSSASARPAASVEVVADAAVSSVADARVDARAFVEEPLGDAGASACRLGYGPAEQPFRGPAALSVVGQELRLITNESGKPHVYPIPITPPPRGAPPAVPKPASFVGMRWPPCELAGAFVYCQGAGGAIVRSRLDTPSEPGKTVAKSRPSTRIAAAPLGAGHSVVAFLDLRRTSEGDMLQAFVALDEQDPVRLSEDGAGATTLRLLRRAETAVAVYLDTRTAMVPIHARPMSLREGHLALGSDAVIFVGGAPERGIDLDVSSAGSKSFAFVPMPRETMDFGMAALPIDDPPKDEVSPVWSAYPNGLDPAPLAAAPARDGKSAWVARVRPRQRAPGSPRVLELGRVDASGRFTSLGEIASGKGVTDVALVEDGAGTVWILYGDTTVTWLERRVCG